MDGKSFVTLLKGGKMNPNRPLLFHTPNVWGRGTATTRFIPPARPCARGTGS
ncbi:hypothetical protein ABFY27_08040 [Akkermansia massiliensis]